VRLYGLKMRCKKCVPVMPLVQHSGPPCSKEGRVRHAKKTKYGSQIRLHEIERGHPRLGVVDPPVAMMKVAFLPIIRPFGFPSP